jgi:hypothetical protein
VNTAINSIQLFSNLSQEEAHAWFTQRELMNIGGQTPHSKNNGRILGCDVSYSNARKRDANLRPEEQLSHLKPGNQLSVAMTVAFQRQDRQIKHPTILSVATPSLDDKTEQPDWKIYVDDNGKLKREEFRKAIQTINTHIKACSDKMPNKKVVLSAFGSQNFISALDGNGDANDKNEALKILQECQRELINELKTSGRTVNFTALSANDGFWASVNRNLPENNKIQAVDKTQPGIPGNWIDDDVIIVNAWDPHSLIGNGCAGDQSIDGFIGRNSLCHYAHAEAIRRYNTSKESENPIQFAIIQPNSITNNTEPHVRE